MRERMQEHFAIEENAQKQRERMQEHFAIEENAQKQKESMKYSMRLKRAKDANHMPFEHDGYDSEEGALLASLNIDESKKTFLKSIQKNGYLGQKNMYKATICIVCDNFIIGKEKICWTSLRILLKNEEKLSVKQYHKKFNCILPDLLRKQYMMPNVLLCDMLLSPRASLKIAGNRNQEQENQYSCCESCHRSLLGKSKLPPKFSIANGFAIGHLPDEFNDISDIIASMISRVRPFAYILSFQGGQNKKLKGTFTFFDNNIKQTEGVINDIQNRIPNNVIYCVMCGRFTPEQRVVARQRARVDTKEFMNLFIWLKANNVKFANYHDDPQCPTPVIIEE